MALPERFGPSGLSGASEWDAESGIGPGAAWRPKSDAQWLGPDPRAKALVCLAAAPGLIMAVLGLVLASTATAAVGIAIVVACGFAASLLPEATSPPHDDRLRGS